MNITDPNNGQTVNVTVLNLHTPTAINSSLAKYGIVSEPSKDRIILMGNIINWVHCSTSHQISVDTIHSLGFCPELQLLMIRPQEKFKCNLCLLHNNISSDFKWIFIFLHEPPTMTPQYLQELWHSLSQTGKDPEMPIHSKMSALILLQNNRIPIDECLNRSKKRPLESPENNSTQGIMGAVTTFSNKCLKLFPSIFISTHNNISTDIKQPRENLSVKLVENDEEIIILDDEDEDSNQTEKMDDNQATRLAIPSPISLSSSICTKPVFQDKPFILHYNSTTLTDEEVICLQPLTFVNDNLINFYLKYLYQEKLTDGQRTQSQFFNCFFFTRLAQTLQETLKTTTPIQITPTLAAGIRTTNGEVIPVEVLVSPVNSNPMFAIQTTQLQNIPVVTVAANSNTPSPAGVLVTPNSDRLLRSQGKVSTPISSISPPVIVPDLPDSLDEKKKLHTKIDKWTKKLDIFEKDFIIIPINENSHWYLAMICFPWMAGMVKYSVESKEKGNYCQYTSKYSNITPLVSKEEATKIINEYPSIERSDSEEIGTAFNKWRIKRLSCFKTLDIQALPCVLIFDSLPANRRTSALKIVRNFIKLEWDCRRSHLDGPLEFDRETVRGFSPRVPSQSNLADCGIYLLHYVEMFFANPLNNYTREYFQSSMSNWFRVEHIGRKREDIRALIIQIYERENNTNSKEIETQEVSLRDEFGKNRMNSAK